MPIKTTIDVHSLISKQPVRTNVEQTEGECSRIPHWEPVELLKKKTFNSRLLALTISICGFATFVPLKSRGGSMFPGEYVPRAKGSKGTSLKKVSFRTRDERTIVPAVTNFAQRNDSSPFGRAIRREGDQTNGIGKINPTFRREKVAEK